MLTHSHSLSSNYSMQKLHITKTATILSFFFSKKKKRERKKLPMIYMLQMLGGEPALYRQNHHMDRTSPSVGVHAEAERERMIAIPFYTATPTSNIDISNMHYHQQPPASQQPSAEKHMQSPRPHIATTPLILGLGEIKVNPAGIFLLCTHRPPSPSLLPPIHTPTTIMVLFSLHYSKRKRKKVSPPLLLLYF